MRRTAATLFRATPVALADASWRENGITYLQYLNICTATLHSVLNDKARAKYDKYSQPGHVPMELDNGLFVEKEALNAQVPKDPLQPPRSVEK